MVNDKRQRGRIEGRIQGNLLSEWVFAAIPPAYGGRVKENYAINMFHTNEESTLFPARFFNDPLFSLVLRGALLEEGRYAFHEITGHKAFGLSYHFFFEYLFEIVLDAALHGLFCKPVGNWRALG